MNRNQAVLLAVMAAFVFVLAPAASAQVQVPLSPNKIPQFAQPLDTLANGGVPLATGTAIDLSICEFQTTILPPGTIKKGSPAPPTWVWDTRWATLVRQGFCPAPTSVRWSSPRGDATTMTFYNKLPDANVANVKAYAGSTDPTLFWGDPLSAQCRTASDQLQRSRRRR